MTVVIVEKNSELVPEQLVGKIILREAGKHWFSLFDPALVTAVSGKSLETETIDHYWDDVAGAWIYGSISGTLFFERKPGRLYQIRTVRAYCDTAEEVNQLMAIGREYEKKFFAVIKDSRQAIVNYASLSDPEASRQ